MFLHKSIVPSHTLLEGAATDRRASRTKPGVSRGRYSPTVKPARSGAECRFYARPTDRGMSMALTEAKLLAMPESEYMSDKQLTFFKERLLAMRDDLQRKVDETVEHMREQEAVADPADRATVEEEHALELRTRDRERKLLKKIDQALDRITREDYGYCEETGEPIGLARLLARPTATLSVEAQARRERMQKMYAD